MDRDEAGTRAQKTSGHAQLQYNRLWEVYPVPLMLIFIGALITLTTALVIHKVRVSNRADAANLGEVSEQWLAEHRASHPL